MFNPLALPDDGKHLLGCAAGIGNVVHGYLGILTGAVGCALGFGGQHYLFHHD